MSMPHRSSCSSATVNLRHHGHQSPSISAHPANYVLNNRAIDVVCVTIHEGYWHLIFVDKI